MYREALDCVEEIRGCLPCSADSTFVSRLSHLKAKALYELGQYKRSLIKIKVAMRLMRTQNQHSAYADMKLTMGRVLIRLGRHKDASEELTESYAYYRRCSDYESILHPLNSLAHLHYITGNLGRCDEVLGMALRYASRSSSQMTACVVTRNLAMVKILMGSYPEARLLLRSMDSATLDQKARTQIQRQSGMISLLHLDFEHAGECLNYSLDYFVKSVSRRDVDICHEYLGLLEYYRGNYRKAREYYQKVLDMPEPTASAVAQTLRMMTDVYIAEGKFKKAASTAKKAEDAINKIGERIELGALYHAYGQIYTQKGETETARDYFKKSIDLLKEIGARYELALSYIACGNSESYNRADRLRHLEAARMLFADMDVPKRVEQVDDAILDLKSSAIPNIIRSKTNDDLPVIIAVNREMKRIIAYAEEVAGSELSVLLTGETGTGKDLLARYIHCKSGRTGKFVTVNAAAIPNEMIESELFGYKRGAFTGAVEDKPGRFELADNGTFYLNEIGDATPEFQAKLLEVLEAGQVWRLGECKARKVNFRLIAATNHDLDKRMKKGLFREDLFYRLRQIRMKLPPLSKRPEDVHELVRHFLSLITSIGKENDADMERLGQVMAERNWPGNVRELCAEVNHLWITSQCNIARMAKSTSEYNPASEKKQLLQTLQNTGWNRREVARRLGVNEATVRRRIKKYDLP